MSSNSSNSWCPAGMRWKTAFFLQVDSVLGGLHQTYYALNDAVIARGSLSRILDFKVLFNSSNMCNYRADGLIFSTPTGSTAFPVPRQAGDRSRSMECILLTPHLPALVGCKDRGLWR